MTSSANKLVRSKSIFQSKTFWGVVLTGAIGLVPSLGRIIDQGKVTSSEVTEAALIILGVGTAITGRLDVQTGVYTPSFLPGPNEGEVVELKPIEPTDK